MAPRGGRGASNIPTSRGSRSDASPAPEGGRRLSARPEGLKIASTSARRLRKLVRSATSESAAARPSAIVTYRSERPMRSALNRPRYSYETASKAAPSTSSGPDRRSSVGNDASRRRRAPRRPGAPAADAPWASRAVPVISSPVLAVIVQEQHESSLAPGARASPAGWPEGAADHGVLVERASPGQIGRRDANRGLRGPRADRPSAPLRPPRRAPESLRLSRAPAGLSGSAAPPQPVSPRASASPKKPVMDMMGFIGRSRRGRRVGPEQT